MTNPTVELADRLAEALGSHDVHPDDRARIQRAWLDAGGDDATWTGLPTDVQALIEQIERSPRQAWDDQADVPDTVA